MATGTYASMAAVIIGGTGATGKCLIRNLLQAKNKVSKVTMLSRRALTSLDGVDVSTEESQGRLIQHVEDLETVSDDKVKELCTGSDVFFNCMGTNLTTLFFSTPSAYKKQAFDIPVRITKLAHQAGVPHYSVLTAVTSNPNSWSLYIRSKGQLEATGQELFAHTSAFRAGQLDRGEDSRTMEKIGLLFRSGLPVSTLAEAMFLDAWDYYSKDKSSTDKHTVSIYYDLDIQQICRRNQITSKE